MRNFSKCKSESLNYGPRLVDQFTLLRKTLKFLNESLVKTSVQSNNVLYRSCAWDQSNECATKELFIDAYKLQTTKFVILSFGRLLLWNLQLFLN